MIITQHRLDHTKPSQRIELVYGSIPRHVGELGPDELWLSVEEPEWPPQGEKTVVWLVEFVRANTGFGAGVYVGTVVMNGQFLYIYMRTI